MTPENFRAAFTAAEGWGTLEQIREGGRQRNRIVVRYGQVRLGAVTLETSDERGRLVGW